jgi:hypothetical protein
MQKRNLRVTNKNVHLNKLLAAGLTAMIVHPAAPTAETFKFSYRRFREKTPDSVTWHNEEDDCYEITKAPDDFGTVSDALSNEGVTFASAEVTMIPQTMVELTSEDDIKKMRRILALLDEEDDVQNVYHNWDEPIEDEE